MTIEELTELRNLFRREFEQHDFCIGQEQVERVFRTLLGEPEPPEPVYDSYLGKGISADEVSKILQSHFTTDKLKSLFERDSAFFGKIK